MSITTKQGEQPMTMKNPPHPGGVVLRQCIEPLDLTITDAAEALGEHGTEAAFGPLQKISLQPTATDDLKALRLSAHSSLQRLEQRLQRKQLDDSSSPKWR